ncbi:MAG: hypothetical protein A3D26_02440 [Candidatus Blackburnbacteria bacterium RIFCSPHIGHO2_02_FULL_44_20]|uniref:Uncharacterized protein n=1 Tax=Candidatus Blackburnbacteria bacterium RIFCSPHIGHO2_02_FULL_44_20 TaxID=1797516 RepID=A0A1G1V7T4_9BACT|nr:MAG: hypothetical protein A3D26_02440 [Candidatus Blackburnbacteria bacterium RIFCSPHIGHO2_02_FULL_44_20]OGY11432.1 MAG: hypothetical protein A3E16_02105 [Candidatus Blackburnbacteria bacterium RIFCSPHIGHO2_12_FULL_44_25]OGY14355.1 MAG: hypothetical protein A3A62_01675 [Candidatus Blackburnbacteria bacterium RIFCSPLOWO2_01_FULL_44_43]
MDDEAGGGGVGGRVFWLGALVGILPVILDLRPQMRPADAASGSYTVLCVPGAGRRVCVQFAGKHVECTADQVVPQSGISDVGWVGQLRVTVGHFHIGCLQHLEGDGLQIWLVAAVQDVLLDGFGQIGERLLPCGLLGLGHVMLLVRVRFGKSTRCAFDR